jgi:3-oxoacyl-(acyl-carrier-protein) synthase
LGRIFITGLGIISPLGRSLNENLTGLRQGRRALTHLEQFATRYAESFYFGEIKTSNEQLKERLKVKEPGVTRTTLLALHALEEALADSRLAPEIVKSPQTALVGANTVGGMCLTNELYRNAVSTDSGSEYLNAYDAGATNLFLQKRFGIHGIVNTINTACSSSANALMYGARLIKNGLADRAIVGGTDSLAKFTINGFNALYILSPDLCRPFDKDRKGLNLGEGAAFLVLENERVIKNKKVYAEFTGWANTNDAYHPSSLSPMGEGPFEAMKEALVTAKLNAASIDYINTHGTGTENNDEVEGVAMKRMFNEVPPFASSKSNIGHTLGASGAIEAVYSVLSLQHQELYPSLGFDASIPAIGLTPTLTYQKADINHVMSNSFGFGGNCSSLIFSKA